MFGRTSLCSNSFSILNPTYTGYLSLLKAALCRFLSYAQTRPAREFHRARAIIKGNGLSEIIAESKQRVSVHLLFSIFGSVAFTDEQAYFLMLALGDGECKKCKRTGKKEHARNRPEEDSQSEKRGFGLCG